MQNPIQDISERAQKIQLPKRSNIQIEANKKHIKNLSHKELTKDQINLLAKRLTLNTRNKTNTKKTTNLARLQ